MPALIGQPVGRLSTIDPSQASPGRGGASTGVSNISPKIFAATKDFMAMQNALKAFNPVYFTTARLAQMNSNDLLYTIMSNAVAIDAILP